MILRMEIMIALRMAHRQPPDDALWPLRAVASPLPLRNAPGAVSHKYQTILRQFPLSESPIILRAMRNLLRKIPANPRQEPQHHLLHLRGK